MFPSLRKCMEKTAAELSFVSVVTQASGKNCLSASDHAGLLTADFKEMTHGA